MDGTPPCIRADVSPVPDAGRELPLEFRDQRLRHKDYKKRTRPESRSFGEEAKVNLSLSFGLEQSQDEGEGSQLTTTRVGAAERRYTGVGESGHLASSGDGQVSTEELTCREEGAVVEGGDVHEMDIN
ncbi:unnamed protein product [Choristocarpus tenellus]